MSSPRVCYVERSDRGVRLRRARLAGMRTEEVWTPSATPTGTDVASGSIRHASELAGWLRDRLSASRGGARSRAELDVLCVDADSAACAWTAAPSFEAPVVEAVLRQRTSMGSDGDGVQPSAIATISTVYGDRAEVAVQALASGAKPSSGRWTSKKKDDAKAGAGVGVRVPVLAVPDATVRVLADDLDKLGVQVGSAISIWHAIALAWDQSWTRVGGSGESDGRVVSEAASTQATVIVDAEAGRVLWVWSREGRLIAAGSMLTPTEVDGDRIEAHLTTEHAARLATAFLSWGVQTGASPARIVVVATESSGAAGFGGALAQAMSHASVDMAIDADPIGSTLRRLAERVDSRAVDASDPQRALVALGMRPSRAHRSMYRWIAIAIALLAALIGASAWRMDAQSSKILGAAREARAKASEAVAKVRPAIADSPFMAEELETELAVARRRSMPPDAFQPARPIMRELEGLSFLLSMPTLTLEDIDLSPTNGRVTFFVPDTVMAQEIEAACRDLEGLSISWKADIRTVEGNADRRVRCTLTGLWPSRAGGGS